jgi:hypothetical protein
MAKFATHGVLSASTGILMGDIGDLYKVVSHLLGRSAYTHELSHYGKRVADALLICHPELPDDAPDGTWQKVRDDFIAKWGSEMELDPALDAVLADDKNPVETLRDMGFGGKIITL